MQVVRPTLCYQVDLGAGSASRVSIGAARGDPKFLQRIKRGPQRTPECVTLQLIVIIKPVEHYICLITAGTVY